MRDMKSIYLPLEQLAEGELQKKIDYELKKLFDNIHDKEMNPTTARTLTLKIKFTPDPERKKVSVDSSITTTLANVSGVSTTVVTGRNQNTGRIQARELRSGVPGQTYIDDVGELRSDTGDLIDQKIHEH